MSAGVPAEVAVSTVPARVRRRANRGPLPGFGLSLGVTLTLPVPDRAHPARGAGVQVGVADRRTSSGRRSRSARALAAYRISFGGALARGLVNGVFGLVLAWVLMRYRLPGKALLDAMVDLPFALPTAVAGIALTALFAENGWIGRFLEPHGIKVAFAPRGRGDRDDLRRAAVRRAHGAAGADGHRPEHGGGRGDAGRLARCRRCAG